MDTFSLETPRCLSLCEPKQDGLPNNTVHRRVFLAIHGWGKRLDNRLTSCFNPFSALSTAGKFPDFEVSSLLVYSQSNLELQFVHTFHYSQTVVEIAMSIASINIENYSTVFAVGTALLVKGEADPQKGRIHLFRWDVENSRLEPLIVHDVNGPVYRIVDFNGRVLAGIGSSVGPLSRACHLSVSLTMSTYLT